MSYAPKNPNYRQPEDERAWNFSGYHMWSEYSLRKDLIEKNKKDKKEN